MSCVPDTGVPGYRFPTPGTRWCTCTRVQCTRDREHSDSEVTVPDESPCRIALYTAVDIPGSITTCTVTRMTTVVVPGYESICYPVGKSQAQFPRMLRLFHPRNSY
eukprot:2075727-Rhodomonas_salina.1